MRLEEVEIGEVELLDQIQRAGFDRALQQLSSALGTCDEAVEAGILAARSAAWPDVGHGNVGRLAEGIGANLAAKQQAPLSLIGPKIVVRHLEGAPVLRFEPGAAGIAIAAI